ncbi:MAG TPA: DUF2905 domain-containing protein [Agriterribacter sp.]|nr:DUF2905 domain-containing protein [Chitinophagaceae bacterium]HRP32574.1 DUF2905 domain-containing protein [Agriterribacter sp.]
MSADTGKYMIAAGILLVIGGLIIYFFHDKLHWIGRLPGDIRFERNNFRFYFPVSTMILISIILSLLLWLFKNKIG